MNLPTIEHIGILVENLEEAVARWTAATGYRFSPIVRYRTSRWVDSSDPAPHDHDARICFSKEGPPRIELMEVTGRGTHAPSELGVHHVGFHGIQDPEGCLAELAEKGVDSDAWSLDEEGRMLVAFTDKRALDGIRLELVTPRPNPIVADDGAELARDPVTGRVDVWHRLEESR